MQKVFWISITKTKFDLFFRNITSSKKSVSIFTPNPEILLLSVKDKEYKKILTDADYRVPDGIWIFVALQILNSNLPWWGDILLLPFYVLRLFFWRKWLYEKYWERICWAELTIELLKYANENKLWISIIDWDSSDYPAKKAMQKILVDKLNTIYPDIQFHLFIYRTNEIESIISAINSTEDSIILSTVWMKIQEKLIIELLPRLKQIKIWIWVWSSIDYIVWLRKRAPKMIADLWFEWLWKIFTTHNKFNRLKRIYNAVFVFIYHIILDKKKKVTNITS